MFNAKDLLDILMKGAQPAPPPQSQGGGVGGLGDLGGLGDILGKMMQGGGQGQAPQVQQGGGQGGGGLADILGQLQKQLGGGAQAQAPNATPQGGGLGDILGQLQKQLGGQTGQPQQQGQQGGGLMDILGQVLGQATSGAREGAGKLDQMTGASERAREAMGQATGRSPEELLAELQEWIKSNPGTAAAGAGGLGAVVLGTRAGRSVATSAAKLGALALIGGLAYKAYQNYSQGRPLIGGADSRNLLSEAAPAGTGFEPAAISNESALLYIRAMIAAAASDGRIDANEQKRIIGSLQQAGLEGEARAFLEQEIANPASPEDLAQGIGSPAEAVQVYTAARLAIDPDTDAEGQFLSELAERLGIDANLANHIDATAHAAAA